MGIKALTTPQITVNNITIDIVPNSFTYTEGFGEQNTRTQSAGGGQTTTVFSDNAETKMSAPKFSLFNTKENIDLARSWKANLNDNAISAVDNDGFTRFFANASLNNDYEVAMGADTAIDLEFMSDPAV